MNDDMKKQQFPLNMFGVIGLLHGNSPWGKTLDAGTGVRSARWVTNLETSSWTLVSADQHHLEETRFEVAGMARPQDRFVLGNWTDPDLLKGEIFDTVIADYLIGSIEGYAPYFQYDFLRRLRPHIGGQLYVIGTDPYLLESIETPAGALLYRICRLRDGCAVIVGVQPYREYPVEWVAAQMERAHLKVVFCRRFPKAVTPQWMALQFYDIERLLQMIDNVRLARALQHEVLNLKNEYKATIENFEGVSFGYDYVISAIPQQ